MVDDIDMAITHVIRGEDLLPTTPRGILVWEAFASLGWPTDGSTGAGVVDAPGLPVFAHLPLLVNEQRKKLSKRRDPVAVESYRDQGYLPEAFVNYLGLLGWSPPGGEEIFDTDQMMEWFRLEDVNHSPAFFDVAKLTHMNGEYIRAMALDDFIEACRPWLTGDRAPWPAADFDPTVFARLAPLVQERVAVLGEVPAMVDFLFLDQPDIDEDSWAKAVAGDRRPRPSWPRPSTPTRRWPTTGRTRPSTPPPWPWPRGSGASWARPRRRSGWPSPAGGSARRCSRRSRCSAPTGPWTDCGRAPAAGRAGDGRPARA